MKRWFRRLLLVLFGLAVVGALIYAFLPKPVGVDLAAVSRGFLAVTVDEDGKTRLKERYVVAAPLAGRLQRIELKAGDSVRAGNTVVASIEPTDPALLDPRARAEAEARVRAAEAKLKQAGPELERSLTAMQFAESKIARIRQLYDSKAATKEEVEERELLFRTMSEEYKSKKFAEDIARFELELAQAALVRTQPDATNGHFEIHAPITGRVLRVHQESATIITPGTQLLELGDPGELEVAIDVLSNDAVQIKPGAKVYLEQWGGEKPLVAAVRLVEPQAFTKISALGVEEQRVYVIADFVDPPATRGTLGDQYRVEARIVIWEGDNVLRVPTSALFREGEEWSVFVVENNRAVLTPVKIGRRNALDAEVLDGLSEGQRVVLYPSDKTQHGVAVYER